MKCIHRSIFSHLFHHGGTRNQTWNFVGLPWSTAHNPCFLKSEVSEISDNLGLVVIDLCCSAIFSKILPIDCGNSRGLCVSLCRQDADFIFQKDFLQTLPKVPKLSGWSWFSVLNWPSNPWSELHRKSMGCC